MYFACLPYLKAHCTSKISEHIVMQKGYLKENEHVFEVDTGVIVYITKERTKTILVLTLRKHTSSLLQRLAGYCCIGK